MSLRGPIISIEDDDDDRYLITELVKEMGIHNPLRFFHNGREALDYLQITEEQPLVILCDIAMPELDGIKLRELINANDYLRRKAIPFVFYTSGNNKEKLREQVKTAYVEDVQGFFLKPHGLDELRSQFRLIIDYWRHCLHPNSKL
jgi:CheY-like chemotaxis protein